MSLLCDLRDGGFKLRQFREDSMGKTIREICGDDRSLAACLSTTERGYRLPVTRIKQAAKAYKLSIKAFLSLLGYDPRELPVKITKKRRKAKVKITNPNGIMFLDELDRAPAKTNDALLRLAKKARTSGYKLPKGLPSIKDGKAQWTGNCDKAIKELLGDEYENFREYCALSEQLGDPAKDMTAQEIYDKLKAPAPAPASDNDTIYDVLESLDNCIGKLSRCALLLRQRMTK